MIQVIDFIKFRCKYNKNKRNKFLPTKVVFQVLISYCSINEYNPESFRLAFRIIFISFGALCLQGAHCVQDSKDGDADVGEDGHPHRGNAQNSEDKDQKLYEYGEKGILPCQTKGLAGDFHT